MMELFLKQLTVKAINKLTVKVVNNFGKKASSQMLDKVLNAPLKS